MILILVGPRQRGLDLSTALGALVEQCLIITGGPEPRGCESAAALVRLPDYNTESLVAAGRRLAEQHQISRVVSFAEADVIAAAALRAALNLPGQQPDSAAAYRDKALMRRCTAAAGLPTPQWWCVESSAEVRARVTDHGLPMVLKPRSASGSVGIRILRETADLESLPELLPEHLVESFVPGEVVHVDGLMIGSTPIFALPAAYTELGCLAHLSDQGSGSYLLPPEHRWYADLVTALWQVVAALPGPNTLLVHAEFFVRDGHRPVLCEIASRLPGHPIPPMLDRALGTDLRREWLRVEAGLSVDQDALIAAARAAPMVANYGLPPRLGRLVELPIGVPPACASWMQDLVELAQPGDRWEPGRYEARKSGDFILTWTVTAEDAASLAQRVEDSARILEGQVRWA